MASDTYDRSIHHRTNVLTGTDTVLFTLAERTRLFNLQATGEKINPDTPNGLLNTMGARDVELVFYAIADDNGTADVHIVGLPTILQRLPAGTPPPGPRLHRLAEIAVTFGTSTETNLNPVDGEAIAGTWRAADLMTTTIAGTGIKLWDATGVNGIARVVFDPLSHHKVFVYIDNFLNVTRVECMARRIARFNPFS